MTIDNPSRRMLMTAMAALPIGEAVAAIDAEGDGATATGRPRALVAFLRATHGCWRG
jgi:hypothetical protein